MSAQQRQLILCCDGTNNNITGRANDTSVVKLCEMLSLHDDADQTLFYDPGVGNPGELPGATTWDQLVRRGERIAGLAFGRGVYENMAEGYLFLMHHYQPGDQIFIFGFSRGAFTARSVAGMVNMFGILQPHMEAMLPSLLHTYFSKAGSAHAERDKIAVQARTLFAARQSREVPVHFVGVWDTVASVGMFPFGARFTAKPTLEGKRFVHVRQALALDELRAQFRPRLYLGDNGNHTCADSSTGSLQQLWFRGSHCDVGGGYPCKTAGLADTPMAWLISEAVKQGLRLTCDGQSLNSEAAVLSALAKHELAAQGELSIHSVLHANPLWAVTGMELRKTDRVLLDDHTSPAIKPEEHASVGAWQPQFPKGTVWAKPRPKAPVVIGIGALMLLLLLTGFLLSGQWDVRAANDANLGFVRWQLLWFLSALPVGAPDGMAQPGWALAVDFLLIAAYAYVLSWFAVRAFARCAGPRRAHSPTPAWLHPLGWSLTLAVFADIAENLASILCLALLRYEHVWFATFFAVVMTVSSACKWVGLAGTLTLIIIGFLPARVEVDKS